MIAARGQIIWILALILSTSAIIYLERLDIGAPAHEPETPVSDDLVVSANQALAAAERRFEASPGDAQSAAALVLALSVAVQAGVLDISDGRARAEAFRGQGSVAAPEWGAIEVLADLTFGQ
ncbi:hypothetical protein AX760_21600 [Pararhizobium antarcticum]|uniref:Uncharacterized protein n=2 Tax=Pararhizobium antarcticum TaxID=1798805 RepID=A0A657LP00_9HYPH|nr:hypothetical protein AX760_21600 [Pararhizobium antarcticum]